MRRRAGRRCVSTASPAGRRATVQRHGAIRRQCLDAGPASPGAWCSSKRHVTDIVVAAQAGLALVGVQEPIKDVVDMLRRETAGSASTSRRAKKTSKSLGQLGVGRAAGLFHRPAPRMWYVARSPCRVSPAVASYSCYSPPSPPVSSRDRPRPSSGRSPTSSTPPPAGTASTPAWCTRSSPSSPGTARTRNRRPEPRA